MGLSSSLRAWWSRDIAGRLRNDAKFLKRWTKIRERGYWRFIVDRCAIMSGAYLLSYFVIGWILERERNVTVMVASIVGYVVSIFVFGPGQWARAEERFIA